MYPRTMNWHQVVPKMSFRGRDLLQVGEKVFYSVLFYTCNFLNRLFCSLYYI